MREKILDVKLDKFTMALFQVHVKAPAKWRWGRNTVASSSKKKERVRVGKLASLLDL